MGSEVKFNIFVWLLIIENIILYVWNCKIVPQKLCQNVMKYGFKNVFDRMFLKTLNKQCCLNVLCVRFIL